MKTTGKNKQTSLQKQSPTTDFEMETFEPIPPIQRTTGSYRNPVLPKKLKRKPLHFFETA